MAIQFVREQLIDAIINPDKMDLTTGDYNFQSVTSLRYKTPTSDTEVANKAYVDQVAQGLFWKDACVAASTANLTATYANGTNGVGATLSFTGQLSLDGVVIQQDQRVLLKDQTSALENGVYSLTTDGNALGASAEVLFSPSISS